jgi:hypothetical protein
MKENAVTASELVNQLIWVRGRDTNRIAPWAYLRLKVLLNEVFLFLIFSRSAGITDLPLFLNRSSTVIATCHMASTSAL